MLIQIFKISVIYCLRIVLRLFYIFPVNNRKIVFVSWMGRQYACNPKYIFEYMYNHYADEYIYVWSLRNKQKIPDNFDNVQICGYFSLIYMYSMITAKYIITNHAVEPYFPFRKNQKIIYTWHGGGAYKKIDGAKVYKRRNWSRLIIRNIRSKMITSVISSCRKFTEIHSDIWNVSQDKFLSIGMPRNDVLFFPDTKTKEKVYKYYGMDVVKKIVLYAPTYRGDIRMPTKVKHSHNIGIEDILKSLKSKYRETFLFLYRTHYNIYDENINSSNIIFASDYPDMQELLCAVDILITDYSSSIWDFSFTGKPCFIYAPDLKKYREEQGFYTPIEEWPFPLAETKEQLMENILNFDEEKYRQDVKKHHIDLESYETGTACKQFCDLIFIKQSCND